MARSEAAVAFMGHSARMESVQVSFGRRNRMFRTKKALLLLAAASTLFASGCFGGWKTWLQWLEGGFYTTQILEAFNVLNGF
jgi:hypothetical protein